MILKHILLIAALGISIQLMMPTTLYAAEQETKATYNIDTGLLNIPSIQIGKNFYDAVFTHVTLPKSPTGEGFKLVSAVLTNASLIVSASYERLTGIVTIPDLEIVKDNIVIESVSAEIDLIHGSNPPLFEVASVVESGEKIFRHVTFGDEARWTDELRMHEVISTLVSPLTALSVGLKVDSNALPDGILDTVDLSDPATTIALIELDAVLGLKGTVENGELVKIGVTCALCHSDVDDSVMEGIGKRLDGYANRDLNPGAILALSPFFSDETSQDVLNSWGPGFYDPRFNQDGINHPVLIPPIYGLADVPLETYTGDGPISYWNSYVAVTQMGARGSFFDPRLDIAVNRRPDLLNARLPALYAYQASLLPPEPPEGSFDQDAALRGKGIFENEANCSSCHMGENLTDAHLRLHTAEEVGMEPVTAQRSATGLYRTTPLRALWQHAPYFHDGSAKTLTDVVTHYDNHFSLGLSERQKEDLIEYLKSL